MTCIVDCFFNDSEINFTIDIIIQIYIATSFVLVKTGRMQRYLQQNVISTLYSQILMKLFLKLMQQKSFTQHFVTIYTIHQTIANHLLLIY